MKTTKKLLAFFMALFMVVSMVAMPKMSVSAATTDTLTVTPQDDGLTHSYEAYQIFEGTLTNDGVMTGIDWGTGVKSADLLTALKAAEFGGETLFASCTSAEDVAAVLVDEFNGTNNDAMMAQFAAIVGKNLATVAKTAQGTNADPAVFVGLTDGYYLVKDITDGVTESSLSRYIVNIPTTTAIEAKAVVPTIDKEIGKEPADPKVKANTASIGDKVPYTLTSEVPNMVGYNKYYYIVKDTMSAGLTFQDDVTIKIGATTLVEDTDYYYTATTDTTTGKTALKIVFINFLEKQQSKAGQKIVINYSAVLNEKANLASTGDNAGNPNVVDLIYSNDPNEEHDGDPDHPNEPGPDEPVGTTPERKVITYTTAIKVNKTDGVGNPLAGAQFTMAGTAMNVAVINEQIFEKSTTASPKYFMLKNGKYTTTEPTDATKASYDNNGEDTYARVEKISTVQTKGKYVASGYVTEDDEKQAVVFKGLNAGNDYTIKETVVPDGYNGLEGPISVTIAAVPTLTGCTWTVTAKDSNDATITVTEDNGIYGLTVKNNSGLTLPSTGGIGTKIFYIAGSILVLFALIMLITKKRMSVKK